MMDRVVQFFTSLRLTVVLLCLAMVLVFVGTLSQVRLGLYTVQSEYFRSFFLTWTPPGTGWKIPVFPGGWCLGLLLLMNLLAAHIKRFKFAWKKAGILLTHAGLILLLVGQFVTEIFQVESQMHLNIGETKNYSEDARKNELAVIDTTDPHKDTVVAIPESFLSKGGEIRTTNLPFALKVEAYLPNSMPVGPMQDVPDKIQSKDGIGQRIGFSGLPPVTTMDDVNKPAARVEILSDKGPIGDWMLSTWLTRFGLRERLGAMAQPQTFSYNGHDYEIALRPVRYYKPYSVTLLEFHHDLYAGTDIPKNFSSKVHLTDLAHGENRDVLIYMNNPLRFRGETYYQASFDRGDTATILQVVRNPASIAPYIACSLVALGLLVQFLMHLIGFARKRLYHPAAPARKSPPFTSSAEPALAASKRNQL